MLHVTAAIGKLRGNWSSWIWSYISVPTDTFTPYYYTSRYQKG